MCNYTYLEKYYHLCGRRAEASREEGQKTVFEMQGAAEQRDAEVSGGETWQLTRVAFRGFGGVGGFAFTHAGHTVRFSPTMINQR